VAPVSRCPKRELFSLLVLVLVLDLLLALDLLWALGLPIWLVSVPVPVFEARPVRVDRHPLELLSALLVLGLAAMIGNSEQRRPQTRRLSAAGQVRSRLLSRFRLWTGVQTKVWRALLANGRRR